MYFVTVISYKLYKVQLFYDIGCTVLELLAFNGVPMIFLIKSTYKIQTIFIDEKYILPL